MGTVVVFIVVAGMVAMAVKSMIRSKKSGKSIQCGESCKDCGGHCCH